MIEVLDIVKRVEGKTAGGVLDSMLARGVLAGDNEEYHVPIPSMEDWLERRFQRYISERPEAGQALTTELKALLP